MRVRKQGIDITTMVGPNSFKTKHSHGPITFVSTTRKIILIIALGLTISAIVVVLLNRFYTDLLVHRIDAFALSIEPADIEKLKDRTLADDKVPYEKVKLKLHGLKGVYPETRFVYLMDRNEGEVSFLADSEPADSSDYSPRGEEYPDATDEDKAIFDNKKSFVEGPVSDEYGTWYSALAPVVDEKGALVAVIGMDVPVSSYAAIILGVGAAPLLVALGLAGAAIFYDIGRRQRMKTLQFQIELTSIASHELSTPLSGIRLSEESLLRDPTLAEPQKKLVGVMYESTLKMQESVEDILQLASLNNGQAQSNNMVALDLVPMISETIAAQALSAEEKGMKLALGPTWPGSIIINGDAVHMQRVFNNVISSNIQSSDRPGEISFSYTQKDNKHVIAIKNNAVNNSKRDLMQAAGSSRGEGGAGMIAASDGVNLFLTRALLVMHHGELRLEPADNNTIVTTIIIPVNRTVTSLPAVH